MVELRTNRLEGLRGKDDGETYRNVKSTLAITVAPPSARRPQPIPPSADWQFHLARGCPAHCQFCYAADELERLAHGGRTRVAARLTAMRRLALSRLPGAQLLYFT